MAWMLLTSDSERSVEDTWKTIVILFFLEDTCLYVKIKYVVKAYPIETVNQ